MLGADVTIVAPFKTSQQLSYRINNHFKIQHLLYPFVLPFLFVDRPFPYQFLVTFHPGYRLLARKYFRGYDIYQFEHASFADLIDFLPQHSKIIYDAHNVEFDYAGSECRARFLKNIVSKRMYRLEKKLAVSAAKIFVCSQEDKKRFVDLYRIAEDKIIFVPNGVNGKTQAISGASPVLRRFPGLKDFAKKAIFCGSNVEHNRVAVRFILSTLAPQLKEVCAFIIKGSCGQQFTKHKARNVFLDCNEGGLEDYAALDVVAINPITQGSGTSLKALYYLSHALPVISTDFGMRGYPDLRPFVTLSELPDFRTAIVLGKPCKSDATDVLKKYHWENIAHNVRNVCLSLQGAKD